MHNQTANNQFLNIYFPSPSMSLTAGVRLHMGTILIIWIVNEWNCKCAVHKDDFLKQLVQFQKVIYHHQLKESAA